MSDNPPVKSSIGIVLLAAGVSRRFGRDKRRATLPGRHLTLLEATVNAARASGLPVHLCLRPDDGDLCASFSRVGVEALFCKRAGDGMGATLAEAVAALRHYRGLIVALGDMPRVHSSTYRTLADCCRREHATIPRHGGQRGNPVCFGSAWFDALEQCSGERGARQLLEQHKAGVQFIDVDDPGILHDVDRPDDLARMDAPLLNSPQSARRSRNAQSKHPGGCD